MPDISEMTAGQHLSKDQMTQDMTLVIDQCTPNKVNVAMDNQPPSWKYVLSFKDAPNGQTLPLNVTNLNTIAAVTGLRNSDDWGGQTVTLFNDMSVSYNGKFGGIRVRQTAPQGSVVGDVPPVDDIPFP